MGIVNKHTKDFVTLLLIFGVSLRNFDNDPLLILVVFEDKSAFRVDEVFGRHGASGLTGQHNCLVLALNHPVASVCPLDNHFAFFFSRDVLDVTLLGLEGEEAWLVVIDDCYKSPSVCLCKQLTSLWLVENDFKLFVWFPLVIVMDDHFNLLGMFFFEFNDRVYWVEVFARFGAIRSLLCANTDLA